MERVLRLGVDLNTYHDQSTLANLPILSRSNVDGHAIGPDPTHPPPTDRSTLAAPHDLSAALATQAAT